MEKRTIMTNISTVFTDRTSIDQSHELSQAKEEIKHLKNQIQNLKQVLWAIHNMEEELSSAKNDVRALRTQNRNLLKVLAAIKNRVSYKDHNGITIQDLMISNKVIHPKRLPLASFQSQADLFWGMES